MTWRKALFNLHLYVGLLLGVLLALAGLSGSVLVFRAEIDQLLDGELLRVPVRGRPLPLQAVVAAVQAKYPDQAIRNVFPPQSEGQTCRVQLAGAGLSAYVDPYSGTVLGARAPRETLTGFLHALHADLLGGETGRTAVGIIGLLLLTLGATGLILWWPGRERLLRGLRVQWRSNWKRVNFDLHRVLGVLALPLIVLSSGTGVALVFSGFFTRAVTPPRPVIPNVIVPAGGTPMPLDALVKAADAALPGTQTTRIAIPATPQSPLVVRKRLPSESHPNGMSFVHVDPYSGAMLAVEDVRRATAAARVLNWRFPLHVGSIGGLATRVAAVIGGLALPALTVTGYLMWWNRTRSKRRARRGQSVL